MRKATPNSAESIFFSHIPALKFFLTPNLCWPFLQFVCKGLPCCPALYGWDFEYSHVNAR